MNARPKIGMYFYAWYNERRWRELPRLHNPEIGEYSSVDPDVIAWQAEQIISMGIDYLIFELVPSRDWCFPTMRRGIGLMIEHLRRAGMQWSFLMDSDTSSEHSALADTRSILGVVEESGWTDGIVQGPEGRPLVFVFSPRPSECEPLRRQFAEYQMMFPIYLPHWHVIDRNQNRYAPPEAFGPDGDMAWSVYKVFERMGHVAFWEHELDDVRDFNGFCAVAPGYDDRLLKRNPQVAPVLERMDGQQYTARLQKALSKNPEHILIYGWNEYFEATTLEPTVEYGSLYVDLTRDFVRQLRPQALPPAVDAARRDAKVAQLAKRYLRQTPRLLDGVSVVEGCYPVEADGQGEFFWTTGNAKLRLDGPTDVLKLYFRYPGQNGTLRVFSGDDSVSTEPLSEGWQQHLIRMPGAAQDVRLEVDPPFQAPGDARSLGVCIREAART